MLERTSFPPEYFVHGVNIMINQKVSFSLSFAIVCIFEEMNFLVWQSIIPKLMKKAPGIISRMHNSFGSGIAPKKIFRSGRTTVILQLRNGRRCWFFSPLLMNITWPLCLFGRSLLINSLGWRKTKNNLFRISRNVWKTFH